MLFAGKEVDLVRPNVMGILNVTPDSFSDGGRFLQIDEALRQAEQMANEGAVFVDVGGESTRPGASEVSLQEEIERVVPVIERIVSNVDVVVSVDTSKPEVMDEACRAGAGLINDVRALQAEGAIEVASRWQVPVCLMHMQGQPRVMQNNPEYQDVVAEVCSYLLGRADACVAKGVKKEKIIFDPGFGFGKKLEHNLRLMKDLSDIVALGSPVLVGVSRKSMLGAITGKDVLDRKAVSVTAAVYSALNGASILRVHDVDATVDGLKFLRAVRELDNG